jgi:REP element-mobilizing transposase RayT
MRTDTRSDRLSRAPSHPAEAAAHHIYVQLAWWTLGRLPLMSSELRGQVEGHIIALSRRLDAEPVVARASANQVRLLLRLKPNHALSTLVPRLKQGSQDALTAAGRGVHWASGYAAATVSAAALRHVIRRIGDLD